MNKFAERLREARLLKGVSQLELANFLHTTQANISHWEKGIREPDIENIIKLCQYFDVSADYLLGLTEY